MYEPSNQYTGRITRSKLQLFPSENREEYFEVLGKNNKKKQIRAEISLKHTNIKTNTMAFLRTPTHVNDEASNFNLNDENNPMSIPRTPTHMNDEASNFNVNTENNPMLFPRTPTRVNDVASNFNLNTETNTMSFPRKPNRANDETSNVNSKSTMEQEMRREWRNLAEAQRQLDIERRNLEIQKVQMREQTQKQNHARFSESMIRPTDDGALVSGMVRQLQSINVEVKTPLFTENKNPLAFLSEIEKYFKLKGICELNQMLVLENMLDGRAGDWYFINKDNIIDFQDFKNKFSNEFYPISIQYKFRQQWAARRYIPGHGSMLSYFYSQYREGITIEPQSQAYDIIFRITQQFPNRIKNSLAVIDCTQFEAVTRALAQLDNSLMDYPEPERGGRNGQQSINNRYQANHSNQVDFRDVRNYRTHQNRNHDDIQNNTRYNVNRNRETYNNRDSRINLPDVSVPPPSQVVGNNRINDRNVNLN